MATVLVLALVTGLAVFVTATTATAQWALTRAKTSMVADLAAVAAARQGSCSAAAAAAHAHEAQMLACSWQGGDVTVTIGMPPPSALSRWAGDGAVQSWARAGF